jgi:hypothetical protein
MGMSDEVRRGTVISFDPTLWQAAILLDGGDVEATLAVGQWVSADTMAVDSAVAVLIFGETNTDDGVVLGPYGALGSAGIPTVAGVNLGSATGAAAGQARGSGNAVFSGLDLGTVPAGTAGGGQIALASGAAGGKLVAYDGSYRLLAFDAASMTWSVSGTLKLKLDTAGNLTAGGDIFPSAATRERMHRELTALLAVNAQAAILANPLSAHGMLTVVDLGDGSTCIFGISASTITAVIWDGSGVYSAALGTAAKTNLAWLAGVLTIENKRASTTQYSITLVGYA